MNNRKFAKVRAGDVLNCSQVNTFEHLEKILRSLKNRDTSNLFACIGKTAKNDALFEWLFPVLSEWSILDKRIFMTPGKGLILFNGEEMLCGFRYGRKNQCQSNIVLEVRIE